VLAVLVLGKIFLKNNPWRCFVVVGDIVASGWLGLDARGMKLLGEVPQGLPALGLPAIHWADWDELLPLAFACSLLGAVVIKRLSFIRNGKSKKVILSSSSR
jgi:sulfate permease, SulP family